jgi:hypothetical protein
MLKLDNINIEIANKDISKMVTGVTIYESVWGMLKGAIAVTDGINFFDNFIGTSLSDVHFTFQYLEKSPITCSFYMDGISDMVIEKQQKKYIIHIQSTYVSSHATTINSVFSGRSDEIIKLIFAEVNPLNALIHIDTVTDTKGKYIAPNISARDCLASLVNNAYDVKQTGMFLYQRFFDNNAIRLSSLHHMLNNSFLNDNKTKAYIKKSILSHHDLSGLATLGTSDSFKLKEYNMDFIQKVEDGVWGKAVSEMNLDETTKKDNLTKEVTSIHKQNFKLSDKLYSDNIKSIFSIRGNPTSSKIISHKIRVFNTLLEVTDMVALPNLGVGMSISVLLGKGNKSESRQDGKYLVSYIQHKFSVNAGNFIYSQDVGLVRE